MRTTRRRITQSTGARAAAGCAFLVAIALLIPGVTQRFNTAVQWRPSSPFFSPGQVKFDHSANATAEESPPEEAAAAEGAAAQEGGGQEAAPEQQIDLAALNEDQLTEALMWWQSSQKIDGAAVNSPITGRISCRHGHYCRWVQRTLTGRCPVAVLSRTINSASQLAAVSAVASTWVRDGHLCGRDTYEPGRSQTRASDTASWLCQMLSC